MNDPLVTKIMKSTLDNLQPLRIAIVVGSFKPWLIGVGGHYFSAITTARKLSELHKVELINIGEFPAPAIDFNENESKYIKVDYGKRFGVERKELSSFLRKFNPDVVIAFDSVSGLIVRSLCVRLKCGYILVKPGGGIPNKKYSSNPFQVFFTLKDAQWASNRLSHKNGMVACIPNRVSKPPQNREKLEKIKSDLVIKPDDLVVIRISRIDEKYRESFFSSIRLVDFLRGSGYRARLIIVGVCQSEQLFHECQEKISDVDAILTSDEYTRNASEILDIASLNVGIGRGFMEGCALGQYMLGINIEDRMPTVVSNDNFDDFFAENFSMRVKFKTDPEVNKKRIIDIAEKFRNGTKKSIDSEKWFEKNFSEDEILTKYSDILYKAREFPEKWNLEILLAEYEMNSRLNIGFRKFLKKVMSK